MDAIDLLLLASRTVNDRRPSSVSVPDSVEGTTDRSSRYTDSDTEAVDAILSLKQKLSSSGSDDANHFPYSDEASSNPRRARFNTLDSISEVDHDVPTETFPANYRRPRSMSEPWSSTNPYPWISKSQTSVTPTATTSKDYPRNHEGELATSPAALIASFFEKYATIYNKNGRIGIYTPEERSLIISKYRDKRKRRNWKKQIRYSCRKNLADRRIRIRGRFVKLENLPKDLVEQYQKQQEKIRLQQQLTQLPGHQDHHHHRRRDRSVSLGTVEDLEEDDEEGMDEDLLDEEDDEDEIEENQNKMDVVKNTTSTTISSHQQRPLHHRLGQTGGTAPTMTIGGSLVITTTATRPRSNSTTSNQDKSFPTLSKLVVRAEPSPTPSLTLQIRSPQVTPTPPKSGLTINLSQIRSRRDQYFESLKTDSPVKPTTNNPQSLSAATNTNNNSSIINNSKLSFLVQAVSAGLSEDVPTEYDDPPGKRLRRHSIAY